jgi:phospholipid transport system substrate-binding protein
MIPRPLPDSPSLRRLGAAFALLVVPVLPGALTLAAGETAERPAVAAGSSPSAPATAPATAQALCDALLAAMKGGSAMSYSARYALLAPEVERDFDLPLMTRLVVGPPWRELAAPDRAKLVEAFSTYSIATYAQRFKGYSGERFEVDPVTSALPNGDAIVHTKLFTGGAQSAPVQLDYLTRKSGMTWRIIDVYLNGSISELAARRSEYSTVLRQGGASALVSLLQGKSADFAK